MARTNVPVVTLSTSGAATNAGTAADPTNGHVITVDFPLEELVLRFTNTNGSDRVATILAGDTPPALSKGQGNLAITVPATSGDMTVAGLESARYLQSDGTLEIDLGASFAGAVRAFRVPR